MPRIVDLIQGSLLLDVNCRFTACIRNLKRTGFTSCFVVHHLDHDNYTLHLRLPSTSYPQTIIIVVYPALKAARSFRFPGR